MHVKTDYYGTHEMDPYGADPSVPSPLMSHVNFAWKCIRSISVATRNYIWHNKNSRTPRTVNDGVTTTPAAPDRNAERATCFIDRFR